VAAAPIGPNINDLGSFMHRDIYSMFAKSFTVLLSESP
jgi:hypothetical protein